MFLQIPYDDPEMRLCNVLLHILQIVKKYHSILKLVRGISRNSACYLKHQQSKVSDSKVTQRGSAYTDSHVFMLTTCSILQVFTFKAFKFDNQATYRVLTSQFLVAT